jgi:hypothetical protein
MTGSPTRIIDAALDSRREATAAQIVEDLHTLGVTAGQVADSLFAMGCAGDRNCESSCVLADWALRTYRDVEHAEVTYDEAATRAYIQILAAAGRRFEVETPQAVADMIIGFDRGRHPELERRHMEGP